MMGSSHYNNYPHILQPKPPDHSPQTPNFNLYNNNSSSSVIMGGTPPFFTLLSPPLPAAAANPSTVSYTSTTSSSFGQRSQNINIPPLAPGTNTTAAIRLHQQSMPPQTGKQFHTLSAHHTLSQPPRVFCLYASGSLLLSNSGTLKVVCSCHGFHMSVSKFTEHSGLRDVNPGDAVHMDSGETIAQWRKLVFSKFGIRIPEDQCGWNWPEGYSTADNVAKGNASIPNHQTKSPVLSESVRPSRPYAAPRHTMISPDHQRSNQNLVHALDKFKTSQSNGHGAPANKTIDRPMSGCSSFSKFTGGMDNAFKPVPTYSDKRKNYTDGDIMDKTKVSSNIELRLGQPSQQNQTFWKLKVPGFSNRVSRVDHPLELISSQRLIYNDVAGSNRITEESKVDVNCAAQAAKFDGSTEGQNRLGFSSLGFGAYSTRTAFQPEQLRGKLLEHTDHGFPRPVASPYVSPRPPLISKAPSMVFSSMVINSSPNMTTSMPKVVGTRVLNSCTPSSNLSSFCGAEKVQNVSGNPLNGSLWSSIKAPSKSTASTYNLPEVASKPVCSGTTSWTANGAEKSAVISVSQENSFQIGKNGVQSNRYQTGPPLPRLGITEDICSSFGHGNCFHGTSCAYVPENCSCLIQKNNMVEKSKLDGKQILSAFGEPSKIRAPVSSTSNLQDVCSLRDGSVSLGNIGETIKPSLKKVEFNTFQWKDVPNKMAGKCNGSCRDETVKFLEDRVDVIDQTSNVVVKSIDQPVQKVDSMKEQVMSNISSKCSAPALTQASVKISNGDSCTDDAQNTDCAKNWSSDDCSNTGFDGFSCKIDSRNVTQPKSVPDWSTRSLVDELRVIDSLRLKKVRKLAHMHKNSTSKKTFEKESESRKTKGEKKFQIREKSFIVSPISSISTGDSWQSSQSLEDVQKLNIDTKEFPCKTRKRVYDDFLEIPESSRGKKARTELEFSKTKSVWKQELPSKRFTRPVVCGRYGLISNGDTSKPAKIFSLKKIYKDSRRCSPVGDEFVKKSPVKVIKKPLTGQGSRQTDNSFSFKDEKCYMGKGTEVYSDVDTTETSDSDFGTEKKRKSKKIRKRSLHELITKEKSPGLATISKNIASIPQDNLNIGGNANDFHGRENLSRSPKELVCKSTPDVDKFCDVCGSSNNDELNCLLECNRCLIKVHQACYGISKVPKNDWYCRPCRDNATNTACVLCGYEGGVMTRALHGNNFVRSLINARSVVTEPKETQVNIDKSQNIICEHTRASLVADSTVENVSYPVNDKVVMNSVAAGLFDPTVKQWLHMVCGLWTPDTRCPNVDTMSAFDVSGVSCPNENVVCSMCKRPGGCCIRCRVMSCAIHFHPWCAHQKGLLQSEVEGADSDKVGFYGRCELHATKDHCCNHMTNSKSIQAESLLKKETCARTEGYKGRKLEGFRHDDQQNPSGGDRCMVQQEQVDAWNYINQQLLLKKRFQKTQQPVQDVESDFRKEYARYKQSKGWKHLVVYKSGIHALGLYTSLFISQSAMVVEYVGEIVGLRVADRREAEYLSGKQLQYKSACYFFKIDKENIIDATRKGGIARFVNHSCQPNCVAKVVTVRGVKKVVFFAERDIYPGEEITYDYHFNNEDEGKKILCSCNSSICRRYLN